MPPAILNLDALTFTEQQHGERFAARHAAIANRIGGDQLGYRLTVVPPGKSAWPYHAHLVNEEMVFVLEGRGSLRLADGNYPLRAGDFVALPAGRDQPHEIFNDSPQELRYLAVSTMRHPEVCLYPDSAKFGVIAGQAPGRVDGQADLLFFGRLAEGVEYWEGEGEIL